MGALFNPVLAQQSGPAWEDVLVWSTNGFQEGEIAVNKSSNPEGKPLDAVRTDRFSLQQGLRETVEAILFPIVIVPINQFRGRPGTSTGSDCLRLTSILHAPGAWCSDPPCLRDCSGAYWTCFIWCSWQWDEVVHPIRTVILEEIAQGNYISSLSLPASLR